MEKLNELFAMIEGNGKQLEDAEIQLEGSKLIVIDDNAESSDDAFVWEGHSVSAAYEFLNNNGYLK